MFQIQRTPNQGNGIVYVTTAGWRGMDLNSAPQNRNGQQQQTACILWITFYEVRNIVVLVKNKSFIKLSVMDINIQ